MKKGKRSADERARGRLLEYWQRRPEFGEPIGCIATSYTFDAAFFEEQCLGRFVGMETDPNEDARAYVIEREEKLSQPFVAVLVDQAHVPMHRSLRWHAIPVRVPRGGILHAKLSLLIWQDRIRAVIASANLSEAGYRRNLEVAGILEFTPAGVDPLELLEQLLAFVAEVGAYAAGASHGIGAHASLRDFLDTVRTHVREWSRPTWPRGGPEAVLATVGPGRPSLFEQLRDLWRFAPATSAYVVSPFFDPPDRATRTAEELEAILIQRDQDIHFVVSGRQLPDDRIELDIPVTLRQSKRARTTYHHHRIVPEEGEEPRSLHAKCIWLERDGQALYCLGSSNFTQPGTGSGPAGDPKHIELDLVYVLPSRDDEFARVCERAWPSSNKVDPGSEQVSFRDLEDRTPEANGSVALPSFFDAAVLEVGPTGHRLELAFSETPPAEFSVELPGNQPVLTSLAWNDAGRPTRVIHGLPPNAPPSFLQVVWSSGVEAFRGIWPINVSNPALLPPPEELRELTLEDLLTVLTSARPAHEVIARLLQQREAGRKRHGDIETDPLKKVDTRHHLLKRMRRAATAMEELRARLERPTFTRDALRARLYGPLGPLALAAKLVAEEPSGASFMLAELATTLAHAKLDPKGELSMSDATADLHAVLQQLATMAASFPAPPNLAAYVAATFKEALP